MLFQIIALRSILSRRVVWEEIGAPDLGYEFSSSQSAFVEGTCEKKLSLQRHSDVIDGVLKSRLYLAMGMRVGTTHRSSLVLKDLCRKDNC